MAELLRQAGLLSTIVAVIALWMMVTAVLIGSRIRSAQFDMVRSSHFAPIRRFGLWRGSWQITCGVASRHARGHRRQYILDFWLRPLTFSVMGWFGSQGLLISFYVLVAVDATVDPGDVALAEAFSLAGLIVAVATFVLWFRGLAYIRRPRSRAFWVKQAKSLIFPAWLSAEGRDRLSLNAFWYQHVKLAEVASCFMPWIILVRWTWAQLPAFSTAPKQEAPVGNLLGVLVIGLLLVAPSITLTGFVGGRARRRLSGPQAAVEICRIFNGGGAVRSKKSPVIPDPLAGKRERLARIANLLTEAAQSLDARQLRGHTPHPTASVLRGAAGTIRQFLRGPQSYSSTASSELQRVLDLVVLILAESANPTAFGDLAKLTDAFDQHGEPSSYLNVKPPSWLTSILTRLTSTVTGATALLAALTGLAVPFIALVLALLGHLDAVGLLEHLK